MVKPEVTRILVRRRNVMPTRDDSLVKAVILAGSMKPQTSAQLVWMFYRVQDPP